MNLNAKFTPQKSKALSVFEKISYIFCIFHDIKSKRSCIVYYTLFWTTMWPLQIFGIYNRLLLVDHLYSIVLVEIAFRILALLTNFIISLDLLFFKTHAMEEMSCIIEKFKTTSMKFRTELEISRQGFLKMSFWILGFNLAAALFNLCHHFRTIDGIPIHLQVFFILYIMLLQTTILVVNICWKLYEIGICLKVLNKEIYHTMMYSYTWIIIGHAKARKQQFQGFLQMYNKLFKALTLASKIYSFHFFLLLSTITIQILHISNLLVKMIADVWPLDDGNNTWKIISVFTLFIMYTGFGTLLTYICDNVVKHLEETIDVACKLLINLPQELGTQEERYIKESLMILTEQIRGRNFQFTAGGLFTVDMTALFQIFGSIAMYLIIIPVQF